MRAGLWILLTLAAAMPAAAQAPLSAQAAVESQQVYLGQPFVLQIQVEGSDEPDPPDVSALSGDFNVQEAGGGSSSSQSISIVNGRMERVVRRGYNFNYQLAAKKQGRLTIPSLQVRAGNRVAATSPIAVQVLPPEQIDDFKLTLRVLDEQVYVGQPVSLIVTWYIGSSVDQFSFNVPVLEDDRFEVLDPRVTVPPGREEEYVEIPIGDSRVTARRKQGRLDGRDFLTLEFEKILVPKQAGALEVPAASVTFRAQREDRRRPRTLFDDFFGGGFSARTRSQTLAIPSNRPSLNVKSLPAEGRPANFSGLIGDFQFAAEASPLDVNVGDPITLKVSIAGPEFLDYVKLPDLQQQPELTAGFKVPDEMSPGEVQGRVKVFTQTIRANHSGVTEVPALEMNYFDPKQGRYVSAKTDPIPLTVNGSRVLTAADAEGAGPAAIVQSELESSREGIAHNYESLDALEDQAAGFFARMLSSAWGAAVLAPPAVFLTMWAWTFAARRKLSGDSNAAKRAFESLQRELTGLSGDDFHDRLLEALQSYLSVRLGLPPGALTFGDVRTALLANGIPEDVIVQLKSLFDVCEARRYAGGAVASEPPQALAQRARTAAQTIEEALR